MNIGVSCYRLLDSMKMTGPMGNPRQPAGFAISDILELDRNGSGIEHQPTDAPLYGHPPHDISAYVPSTRHWPTITPEGRITIFKNHRKVLYFYGDNF